MTGRLVTDYTPEPGTALRVRMVTPGFPPDRGGVEEHCHQLAVRLAAAGDRVSVLTASRGEPAGRTRRTDGLDVRTFRAWRPTSMSLSPRLTLAGVAAPAGGADITHVHSYHASAGFAAIGGRHRPLVFTPHYHGTGHSPLARGLHRGYRLIGRAMLTAADAVICVSEAERAALVRDFPAVADRVRVIPNGVDRATIRAAEPFPGQPPTVLVVGRLEPYKHVDTVLRAFAALPATAQLVVIGTGSESDALRRMVDRLGLGSRVRLPGAVGTEELHRWLRTARALVSLSEHEAFGMVPLEAATAGTRVVLSDIAAHREIADKFLGSAAEVVPAPCVATVPAVTAALARALDRTDRVVVEVPDWSDVASATRTVYLDVLAARSDRGRSGHPFRQPVPSAHERSMQ